tara:strand:+ start:533 stop:727 length:195 start_codon:yes stop_codon:yes gene_type:complete
MAKNMEGPTKMSFPNTNIVTDRLHDIMLVIESLQYIIIKYRWKEIADENTLIGLIERKIYNIIQ